MADKINIPLVDIKNLGFGTHGVANATEDPYAVEKSDSTAMTNNVYGINHRQTPLPIPINKDRYGYTFFTRPQLNMQRANLRSVRLFAPLLTQTELSYERMIRCILDPRMQTGYGILDKDNEGNNSEGVALECGLVDGRNAFIPILTNSLTSISGWPDISLPTFSAPEGSYKEGYSIVDGVSVDYTTYDITANFRNSKGDPIVSLFYYWCHYMAHVFEGSMVPYPDFISENEIDYNTRIYRLVMDPTNTKVTRIAACGASFPLNVPTGGLFDFSSEKPYNDVNANIAINFRAMGFVCQDDMLIRNFNYTVGIFNRSMRKDRIAAEMVQIPRHLLPIFNNRGYPFIEPNTKELQWYIDREYYNLKLQALNNFDQELDNALGLI